EAEPLFRQKWAEILPLPPGVSRVQFDSESLKDHIDRAFPDLPGHYYPVRYYCPDLMVAAADLSAIERGEALYVLGEVHSGKNSLLHTALTEQHPNPRIWWRQQPGISLPDASRSSTRG